MSDDPRATQVCNKSDQQQEINQVLTQLQGSQNINAFFVLSKFIDCPEVKNQPEFCQILFNEHLEVVLELIEWMLLPKQVVKKKKIKANVNVDSYPYQCREFMKDNWCFYEQMYIAARNKKLQFGIWFNFLRKEYFDKDTIYTALGYFADVMIPFAKYEFSGSFNLTQSLEATSTSKSVQTLSIMKILPEILIDELIKYAHYDAIYIFLKTAILVSIEDPRDYEISRSAFLKLLKGAQLSNLFSKFPILSQQANDQVAKAMDFLENVANGIKQMSQNIQLNSQSAFRTTAMISVVVESNIIRYAVNQLLHSRLCGLMGKQKQKDRLHSSTNSVNEGNQSPVSLHGSLGNSTGNSQQLALSLNVNINVYNHSPLPALGALVPLTDTDEEQLVQTLFRILSGMVEVFVRIPRTLNVLQNNGNEKKEEGVQAAQIIVAQTPTSNSILPKSFKQKPKQFTYEQYSTMTNEFREQMQFLLDNMQTLTKFVYNETENGVGSSFAKIVPFASGQNVKAISFMKYQYFKLIHNVLIMIQCKDPDIHPNANNANNQVHNLIENQGKESKQMKQVKESKESKQFKQTKQSTKEDKERLSSNSSESSTPKDTIKQTKQPNKSLSVRKLKSITIQPFQFKIQKLQIIEIIKKYLSDNRWNNLAHHLLEKITHLLIMCSYDYIKKNIEKDKNKKFSDSFLAFLIENFTKRDFVFLNTVKFTSQGNLHSLYNIAKDLAYTLNSTNQLVLFLNEFEPWKKFIMTDLKNYQEKTFPKATKPEEYDKNQNESCTNLKVDEADSIKKLIQNISTTKKWPSRTKNKSILSKSGIFQFRSSGDAFLKSQTNEHIQRTQGSNIHSTHSTQKQKSSLHRKQKQQLGLQQILKKRIQYSKKGSEVRQFDIQQISVRDKLQQNRAVGIKSQSQLPKKTEQVGQKDGKERVERIKWADSAQ